MKLYTSYNTQSCKFQFTIADFPEYANKFWEMVSDAYMRIYACSQQ